MLRVETVHDILLIEDNPDARETVRLLLELEGYRVAAAETGEQGIQLARDKAFAIGLIDIGLPDLDGYTVAQRIRAAGGAGVVLIALTGYSDPDDVRRARAAGFDAHLVKPVDPDTLTKTLTDITSGRR